MGHKSLTSACCLASLAEVVKQVAAIPNQVLAWVRNRTEPLVSLSQHTAACKLQGNRTRLRLTEPTTSEGRTLRTLSHFSFQAANAPQS